jgi:LysM repeat protein
VAERATRWSPNSAKTKPKADKKKIHVVEKGDTLGGIAKRYDSSIELICEANKIAASDPIRPGQELVVPVER